MVCEHQSDQDAVDSPEKIENDLSLGVLAEECAIANQVLAHVFVVMQAAHKEISAIYSEIRARLLSGGELSEDDEKRLRGLNEKWQTKIDEVNYRLQVAKGVTENFVLNDLLLMRMHRIGSLPFGASLGGELNYYDRLTDYAKKSDPADLPEPKELNLSDVQIVPSDVELAKTDLSKTLETIAFTHKTTIKLSIVIDFPEEELLVNYLPGLDLEAFEEIFRNAEAAMPDGGEIKIIGRKTEDQKHLKITISDSGHGMSPEILRKALAGGFSTKTSGTGKGLGLLRDYFEKVHQGQFIVESEEGKGTTIKIILPLVDQD
jgi:anti-sigma regulatory factor (Ser/Thr protein kinase)